MLYGRQQLLCFSSESRVIGLVLSHSSVAHDVVGGLAQSLCGIASPVLALSSLFVRSENLPIYSLTYYYSYERELHSQLCPHIIVCMDVWSKLLRSMHTLKP